MAARYRWDDLSLDLDAYRLERAGRDVPLEPKAFNLLVLMIRRPGHLFSKQEIFDAIWPNVAVTDHALTRVVAQLRRALGDEAREPRYLETVPTRGYRWIQPVDEIVDQPPQTITTPPIVPALTWPRVAIVLTAAVVLTSLFFRLQRDAATSASSNAASTGDRVAWPVQLTTHSGLDFEPAISPHGDAIAFVSDRSGAFEIYVRALTGIASEVPLTSDGAQNVQPAWSPDGASIAFHSNQKGGIWIVPARGGNPRQIATVGSRPAWAPDGRRIAFQSDEHPDVAPDGYSAQNGSTLWLVDVDGGHLEPLTRSGHPVGGHAAPSWSPDGRFVAFSVFEAATDGGIWTVQTDTRDTRLLLPGPGFVDSAFAPDGSALYIAGGEAFIVRVPLDPRTATATGPPTPIPVSGVQSVRDLSIAPDGRRLVFAAPAVNSQIWAQPIDRSGSATSEARALTSDTSRRNSFPAISPDGSKVAYMSTRRGELPNVWVMGIDGRDGIQVTPDDTAEFKPDWLPDGKRIAYVSSRNNRRGLWIGDVDSRREQLLFDTSSVRLPSGTSRLSGRLGELDPSPSMTKIAFSLFAGPAGRRVIYVATPDPFVPRALTDPATSVGYPFWSPDERRLVVEIKDGSSTDAAVIDVDTGRLRRLTHEVGQTWPRSFSPDGQRIAAAVLREGVWSLRWIDVATSRQGTITPASPPRVYVRYPEWSPKSDVVLYERGESTGNIWLLDINRT